MRYEKEVMGNDDGRCCEYVSLHTIYNMLNGETSTTLICNRRLDQTDYRNYYIESLKEGLSYEEKMGRNIQAGSRGVNRHSRRGKPLQRTEYDAVLAASEKLEAVPDDKPNRRRPTVGDDGKEDILITITEEMLLDSYFTYLGDRHGREQTMAMARLGLVWNECRWRWVAILDRTNEEKPRSQGPPPALPERWKGV